MKKKEVHKNEILFKKGKLQGLNRIALPKELLENMGLKEGDPIFVYLNLADNSIILKKQLKEKNE